MGILYFRTIAPLKSVATLVQDVSAQHLVRGWLRDRQGYVEGALVAILPAQVALEEALTAVQCEWLPTPYSDPNRFRKFEVLPSIALDTIELDGETYRRGDRRVLCHIDPPPTNGRVAGYALDLETFSPIEVRVVVDGVDLWSGLPTEYRSGMLKAGHYSGLCGFDVELPAEVRDGGRHEVMVVPSDSSRSIVGRSHGELLIPYSYEGPRPWDGGGQDGRHANFRGTGNADELLRTEIDRTPSMIFQDLGFTERRREEDRFFSRFRDTLQERAYLWNQMPHCDKSSCCKARGMSMHKVLENAVAHFGSNDPAAIRMECPHWPRLFASKLFIKRYGEQFGVHGAKDIAVLSSPDDLLKLNSLPLRHVIKPEASSGVGLFLMHDGINLFDGRRIAMEEIVETFTSRSAKSEQILVEEFLVQEGLTGNEPVIPLDYKMHAFGGKVRLIHVDDRNCLSRDKLRRKQGWFSRDWTPSPLRMREVEVEHYDFLPPSQYTEMLALADKMAADINDYARLDFYATTSGVRLGEITTKTHNGVGFTPFGNMVLSQLWELWPGPTSTPSPVWQ